MANEKLERKKNFFFNFKFRSKDRIYKQSVDYDNHKISLLIETLKSGHVLKWMI